MNSQNFIYDERPGFESYNSVSFPYPGMMPMMPMANSNNNNNSSCQANMKNLENRISNLEDRVQKLENNMYPKATEYSQTYQNSINVM